MLVPEGVFASQAVVAKRWNVHFPCCESDVLMDHLEYVNLQGWPAFRDLLRRRAVDEVLCDCPSSHIFPASVIVEIPKRNLLIYVTHGGDGPHVQDSFGRAFASLNGAAAHRPYTFVHGWRGLEGLLDTFEGAGPETPGGPYPHSSDNTPGSIIVHGYGYGGLFFYDPQHLAVGSTVTALLEFSGSVVEYEDIRRVALIIREFLDFVGPIHPWLVQELGSLYLRLGQFDAAEYWLELSLKLEHRWLAVTRSFLEPILLLRAKYASERSEALNAELQDAIVPHAEPASVLRDVTRKRHVVDVKATPTDDFGLWYFPAMAQAAIPSAYAYKTGLAVQGLMHGRLDSAVIDEGWLRSPGSGDLVILTVRMHSLLWSLKRAPDTSKLDRFYFEGYVLGRWDLAIGSFDSSGTRRRGIGTADPDVVLAGIESRLDGTAVTDFFLKGSAEVICTALGGL